VESRFKNEAREARPRGPNLSVDRYVGAGNKTLGNGRKLFEIFAVETNRKIWNYREESKLDTILVA
jgi:hypothetical protein